VDLRAQVRERLAQSGEEALDPLPVGRDARERRVVDEVRGEQLLRGALVAAVLELLDEPPDDRLVSLGRRGLTPGKDRALWRNLRGRPGGPT
jgi:hypothetical protein